MAYKPMQEIIDRIGDTYVVKYESHVQVVEYRKQSLADALVEMLRYLLRYDFTKQQMEYKSAPLGFAALATK